LVFSPRQAALIPARTSLKARLDSTIDTASSNVGDAVAAVVTKPVRISGKIVVPEQSRLNGRVETISAATPNTEGRVRLVFREIQFPDGRSVSTWITDSYSVRAPRRNLRYVLYMAIGAGAGSAIGGKTARVAGIIGGALVGFIIAGNSRTDPSDVVLKAGRVLELEFGQDLGLSVEK